MSYTTIGGGADFLSISRSTLYRLMGSDPTFPKPSRVGKRRVAIDLQELEAWAKSRRDQ
jgi:predicted DNA-binding transcriptional regulator AlpA